MHADKETDQESFLERRSSSEGERGVVEAADILTSVFCGYRALDEGVFFGIQKKSRIKVFPLAVWCPISNIFICVV